MTLQNELSPNTDKQLIKKILVTLNIGELRAVEEYAYKLRWDLQKLETNKLEEIV